MRQSRSTTLLELVFAVQRVVDSDEDTVRVVTDMINSGRVVLCGSFAGRRIPS